MAANELNELRTLVQRAATEKTALERALAYDMGECLLLVHYPSWPHCSHDT